MNSQYDALMRSYSLRRNKAQSDLAERRARIEAELPALADIETSIAACQAQRVRSAIDGSTSATHELTEQILRLQEDRAKLLESHGYALSDLEPHYLCADCKDTGYVGSEKCHCFRQAEIDLIYHQSHLRDTLRRENFRTFSYSWYDGSDRELMRRNVMDARLFIENFDSQFDNLLFMGAVGTGKTFLSNCIAKELMDSGHSVVYLTAFQLFDMLSKATFSDVRSADAYSRIYPYIFDCDLLIIDDLGTELPNSFTVSQLFLCVNERIQRRKSSLISSNLDMETLRDTYSERTLSRIISCYTIRQFPGSDIRLKKKLQA